MRLQRELTMAERAKDVTHLVGHLASTHRVRSPAPYETRDRGVCHQSQHHREGCRSIRNSNHPWIHKKLKTSLGFVRSCPKKEGGEEEKEGRMGVGERREEEEKDKDRSHKKPKVCLYRDILIPLGNVDSLRINPHNVCH